MKSIRYLGILSAISIAFVLVSVTLAAVKLPADKTISLAVQTGFTAAKSDNDRSTPTDPAQAENAALRHDARTLAPAIPLTLGEVLTWFTPPGGGLPVGLEHDGSGNLYMTEVAEDRVHLIDTNGNELSSFPLTAPQTYNGIGVTTDGNYLYLTDTGGQDVDRYSLAGDYLSSFFVYSETVFPEGITYNPETGNLYVVDGVDFQPPEIIAEYSISGTLSTTYNLPSAEANGLAYDPLRCTYWTYDSADDSVQHLSPSFTLIESFLGTVAAGFASGEGVAVINNTLYVAAKNDNTIVAFDIAEADTTYASLCTVEGTLTGQVTSAYSGLGLPGAAIVATDGVFTYSVFSNGSGYYSLTLQAGTYTVAASLSGYSPVTELDVQIFSGVTVLNFALTAGGLTASPLQIEKWVIPGEIVTHPLTLSNTSLVPVSFNIVATEEDALWVTAAPLSGTILAGDGQGVEVIFDSGMVTATGTYTAGLRIEGDFENDPPEIDLLMHVGARIFLPISRKD